MTDRHTISPTSDNPVDAPESTARPYRTVRRVAIATLVTAGLASAGVVAAAAAAASAPGSPTGATGSSASASAAAGPAATAPSGAPAGPKAATTPKAGAPAAMPAPRPTIDGKVASVASDHFTVTDTQGFTRTIAVSSHTDWTSNGKKSSEDALRVGRYVQAIGTVDSNGTTLDATLVMLSTSGAPVGPPALGVAAPGGAAPKAPGGTAPKAPGGAAPKAPGGAAPKAPAGAPSASSSAHGS